MLSISASVWVSAGLLFAWVPAHVGIQSLVGAGDESVNGLAGGSAVELLAALQDKPTGSFFALLEPLVHAITISYRGVSGPEFNNSYVNATIPLAGWSRIPEVDTDPQEGGVHARSFVNHQSRRAIVTFRGICLDNSYRQCQMDKCFLQSLSAFGSYSELLFEAGTNCSEFGGRYDYLDVADSIVREVQAMHPDYALLLTGHSLGGALAIVSAARQPGVLRAVTFAPTAFHSMFTSLLGMSEVQIAALPAHDLIAIGDPYDCMINAVAVPLARKGSTTCLYEDVGEPIVCETRMKHSLTYSSYSVPMALICKGVTHQWSRYISLILEKGEDGLAPAHVPTCDTKFSTYLPAGE